MALSIKNPEAERLVRRLTAQTGEMATRAIIVALQNGSTAWRGCRRTPVLHELSACTASRPMPRTVGSSRTATCCTTRTGYLVDHRYLGDRRDLLGEPQAADFIDALPDAPAARMSAATYVEAAVVVDANRDPVLSARFDELAAEIEVVPMTRDHADTARQAYRD